MGYYGCLYLSKVWKKRRIRKIKAGDLLIVSPWDIQDEKADIQFKYKRNQAKLLSRRRVLPENINVFEQQ